MNSTLSRLLLALWFVGVVALAVMNRPAQGQEPVKQTTFLPLAARTMPFVEPALADYLLVGKSHWDNKGDMFTLRADGSQITRVAPEMWGYSGASFSPDGEWIVYLDLVRDTDERRVILMRRDGTEKRVINPVAFNYSQAVLAQWSPTGRWLLVSGERRLPPDQPEQYPLYLISAQDPTSYRLIANHASPVSGFSPDGRYIHFQSRNAEGVTGLWVVPVAGGDPVRITDSPEATRVVWNPDSRELFFSDYDAATETRPGKIAAADGSTIRTLYDDGYSFQGWIEGGAAALLRAGFDYDYGPFYTIPREGGAPTLLSDMDGSFYGLSISPYGDALLYTVYREAERTTTLYWHPLPGAPVAVDSCTHPPEEPTCRLLAGGREAWAHDGSGVLYYRQTGIGYLSLGETPPAPRQVYSNPDASAGFLPGSTRYAIGQALGYPPPPNPYPFIVNVETHEIQGLPYPDGMRYTDWRYLPE